MIPQIIDKYQRNGISGLVSHAGPYAYRRFIRPLLPDRRFVSFNNVIVPAKKRVGDGFFSTSAWNGGAYDRPEYEGGYIRLIRNVVQSGDRVVVIGGGWGVSAVAAANQAGETGQVRVYEGAEEPAERVSRTANLNDVANRISVEHAIVGPSVNLHGDGSKAATIHPNELPEMDVLLLDCEGSEQEILRELNTLPKRVVVETHGMLGATTEQTKEILRSRGYRIQKVKPAHTNDIEKCEEDDIMVISARLS